MNSECFRQVLETAFLQEFMFQGENSFFLESLMPEVNMPFLPGARVGFIFL